MYIEGVRLVVVEDEEHLSVVQSGLVPVYIFSWDTCLAKVVKEFAGYHAGEGCFHI